MHCCLSTQVFTYALRSVPCKPFVFFAPLQPKHVKFLEWPHRQCGCHACRNRTFESRAHRDCTDLYVLCASGTQGVLPCEGLGVTASQLDLPSLAPLSVGSCGRLQPEAAHWATWVTLLQVVDNCPHKFVVVDSPLEGSQPKKTLLYFILKI